MAKAREAECRDCGHMWDTVSQLQFPNCPNCYGTNTTTGKAKGKRVRNLSTHKAREVTCEKCNYRWNSKAENPTCPKCKHKFIKKIKSRGPTIPTIDQLHNQPEKIMSLKDAALKGINLVKCRFIKR